MEGVNDGSLGLMENGKCVDFLHCSHCAVHEPLMCAYIIEGVCIAIFRFMAVSQFRAPHGAGLKVGEC